MEHAVEIVRYSRFRQDVAHIDKKRQRQQRIPVEQLEGRIEWHLDGACTIEKRRGRRRDKADGGKDTLTRQQHKQHRGEHEDRDQLIAHRVGLSPS